MPQKTLSKNQNLRNKLKSKLAQKTEQSPPVGNKRKREEKSPKVSEKKKFQSVVVQSDSDEDLETDEFTTEELENIDSKG